MTEQEQLIDALESVERYLRNQDLSEIGMQVKGKVLEALNRVNKISFNSVLCEEKSCEHEWTHFYLDGKFKQICRKCDLVERYA